MKIISTILKYARLVNNNIVMVFNVSPWKRKYVQSYFDDYCIFLSFNLPLNTFRAIKILAKTCKIAVWGYGSPKHIDFNSIDIVRVEDGFIRSKGLGSLRAEPYSYVTDESGSLYFDSTKPSDLEIIIKYSNYSPTQIKRSKSCMDLMIRANISKYNLDQIAEKNYLAIEREPFILVIGQCEDDASIHMGSPCYKTNLSAVEYASNRFPNYKIVFKPHPDIVAGKRNKTYSNERIMMYADFSCNEEISELINKAFYIVTITSLTGMEAIIRNKKVIVLGQPFYSGWGLTEDITPLGRRGINKSIEEIFYSSYIEYAKYRCPRSGDSLQLEDVIELLSH